MATRKESIDRYFEEIRPAYEIGPAGETEEEKQQRLVKARKLLEVYWDELTEFCEKR